MLAASLINPMIPVLKPSDSVGTALDWMDEFGVKQLIVADIGLYQGIVSEDILFDIADSTEILAKIIIQHKDIFATEDQHPYELLRIVNQFGLQIIPFSTTTEVSQEAYSLMSLWNTLSTISVFRKKVP